MASEPKPESEHEGQLPFLFKDKYGSYEMPMEVRQVCDDLTKKEHFAISNYLTRLAHVASYQKEERDEKLGFKKDKKSTSFELLGRVDEDHVTTPIDKLEIDDVIEANNVLGAIARSYQGKQGMANLVEARNNAIKAYGRDIVLKLELFLGVDSGGIDAGDEKPLLGVNKEMVIAVVHYISREDEYQEISSQSNS